METCALSKHYWCVGSFEKGARWSGAEGADLNTEGIGHRKRAEAVELPDEGAWGCRATDRFTTSITTKTPKPAPTHSTHLAGRSLKRQGYLGFLFELCLTKNSEETR